MITLFKKKAKLVQPYSGVINVDKELPDYNDLCNGNKGNYTYTQWKKDILSKLEVLNSNELNSVEPMIDFYHYLINKKRILESRNNSFLPIMICYTSISFGCLSWILPDDKLFNIIKFVIVIGGLILCLKMLSNYHKDNDIEYCFYCDLIEIVEEMIHK